MHKLCHWGSTKSFQEKVTDENLWKILRISTENFQPSGSKSFKDSIPKSYLVKKGVYTQNIVYDVVSAFKRGLKLWIWFEYKEIQSYFKDNARIFQFLGISLLLLNSKFFVSAERGITNCIYFICSIPVIHRIFLLWSHEMLPTVTYWKK